MRIFVACLLLGTVISGCASDSRDGDDAGGVHVVTSPGDYSYLNGSRPDQRAHLHDYWGEADSLVVVSADKTLEWVANAEPYAQLPFVPDEDQVIPLGAQFVDVAVSWRDVRTGNYGPPELWIKTAADDAPEPVDVPLENGGTIRFVSTNDDNDLPHQRLSAWEFVFAVPKGDLPTLPGISPHTKTMHLDVNMTVTATRGLEIPLFPGHPDRWDNQTALPLAVAAGETFLWVMEPPNCWFCSGGIFVVGPEDGRLVPGDAAYVEVTLEYTAYTPTGLELLFHGADTREWRPAPVESDDGSTRVHRIPVGFAGAGGDGPYAKQSQWEFYFGFDGDAPAYNGEWTLEATVHRG